MKKRGNGRFASLLRGSLSKKGQKRSGQNKKGTNMGQKRKEEKDGDVRRAF